MRRTCAGPATGCLALVAALLFTGSARASSPSFTCRGSAARVTALTLVGVEPTVANSTSDPCRTDATRAASLTLPGLIVSGTATASTASAGGSAMSTGQVKDLSLAIPASVSPGSALDIAVSVARSTATARCNGSRLKLAGSSDVIGLTLGGESITTAGSYDLATLLPGSGLTGIAEVALDHQTASASALTQEAVEVTIFGGSLNGVHLVLGEATVGADGNPCSSTAGAGSGPGSSGGSGFGGCPVGTSVDPSTGACVIPAGTEGNPHTVIVPSGDVSGATVMALSKARRKFGKRTACLNGAGPNYVVVGTKRADRIIVRRVRMRVMGLAGKDRITVRGGSRTCVNGGAGNDRIVNKRHNFVTVFGANGSDRVRLGNGRGFVLGGKGNDRIIAGNGKVNLQGNSGNDYIRAGNGPANLNGGNGNDTLIAGTGRAHLNGGSGTNRLVAHGKVAYVKAAKRSRSVAYVRRGSVRYARRHGIAKIHVIKR